MSFKPAPDKAVSEIYPWVIGMEKSIRERARCLNILVAEDNTLSQTLITRLLQKMRHVVTVANDGEEAVALYSKGAFDLIFMDIRMPKLDGMAAAARIRKLEEQQSGSHIPIIAMTAHGKGGDRDRCFAAHMDHYMVKPVSLQGLDGVLQIFFTPADIFQRKRPGWDKYDVLARTGGDEALLNRLMHVFVEGKSKILAEIAQGLANKQPELLQHAARALREQLSYLGANQLSETARQLETTGATGDMPRAAHFAELLQAQIAEMEPLLLEQAR
ncbi:MAG: response regulator [Acidobacteriota bacterium]|nr:response regulator [Acidobacteriota bacterium]